MAIEHSLKMKGEMIPIQHFLDYCTEKGIDFDVADDSGVYLCEWKLWGILGKPDHHIILGNAAHLTII